MNDVDLNAQGDISVGGDVTGRDKHVSSNKLMGDKLVYHSGL
jgi:hypothetical protein